MRDKVAAACLVSASAFAGINMKEQSEQDGMPTRPAATATATDSVLNQSFHSPAALSSHLANVEFSHDIIRSIDAQTSASEQRMRALSERTSQIRRGAENEYALQNTIAAELSTFEKNLTLIEARYDALNHQMAKLESSVNTLVKSGKEVDAELTTTALQTFHLFAETMDSFIELTNSQVKDLPRYPVGAQLDQLGAMYERSTQQLDLARDIFLALQSSKLIDTPEVNERSKELVSSYISLMRQNKELLLESLELSKNQFLSSLQSRGVSPECSEFYYNKITLLSLLEGGQQASAFDISQGELKGFKSILADLSFSEFKEVTAGKEATSTGTMGKVARTLKTLRVMKTPMSAILDIPGSERRQPIAETADKFYTQCVEQAQSVNSRELQNEIDQCLDINPDDLQIDPGLHTRFQSTGPSIGPAPGSQSNSFDSETQQCIADAKRAAREAAVETTRVCCEAYNKGDIRQCNEQGLVSPETDVLDKLKTQDLDAPEERGLIDFEHSRGYNQRSGSKGSDSGTSSGGADCNSSGADAGGGQCTAK